MKIVTLGPSISCFVFIMKFESKNCIESDILFCIFLLVNEYCAISIKYICMIMFYFTVLRLHSSHENLLVYYRQLLYQSDPKNEIHTTIKSKLSIKIILRMLCKGYIRNAIFSNILIFTINLP